MVGFDLKQPVKRLFSDRSPGDDVNSNARYCLNKNQAPYQSQ